MKKVKRPLLGIREVLNHMEVGKGETLGCFATDASKTDEITCKDRIEPATVRNPQVFSKAKPGSTANNTI
jgi:hypothetical protein